MQESTPMVSVQEAKFPKIRLIGSFISRPNFWVLIVRKSFSTQYIYVVVINALKCALKKSLSLGKFYEIVHPHGEFIVRMMGAHKNVEQLFKYNNKNRYFAPFYCPVKCKLDWTTAEKKRAQEKKCLKSDLKYLCMPNTRYGYNSMCHAQTIICRIYEIFCKFILRSVFYGNNESHKRRKSC